jgi:hypothetical protein
MPSLCAHDSTTARIGPVSTPPQSTINPLNTLSDTCYLSGSSQQSGHSIVEFGEERIVGRTGKESVITGL